MLERWVDFGRRAIFDVAFSRAAMAFRYVTKRVKRCSLRSAGWTTGDSSSMEWFAASCSRGSRVSICIMMSDTANCVGGVMCSSRAEAAINCRAAGASSFIDPTSVVSMCDDSGVITVSALRESS